MNALKCNGGTKILETRVGDIDSRELCRLECIEGLPENYDLTDDYCCSITQYKSWRTCQMRKGASLTWNDANAHYGYAIFMSENYTPIYFEQLPDNEPEPNNEA